MGEVDISDSVTLEYDDTGTGEAVVFIHGALIARPFVPLVREPELADYRSIQYCRRGYGGSSRSDRPLSIAEQAQDCAALLQRLGIARAHVVGHSFGGDVALQLAVDSPGLVGSLALLEPALMIGATAASYRESLQVAMQRYRELDTRTLIAGFMAARWPRYQESLEEALPGAFDQAVADASTTFDVELPGLLAWKLTEADICGIAHPVLSVLGSESNALWSRFGEVHQWLLDHLANVEGAVIPGSHHMMMLENASYLAGALARFWSRNALPA